MDELTPRQKEILKFVIDSYITTPLPVGSRTITERYGLHLSPASVRNEMGILEDWGYLTHPHTSAGRVPTDKGYQLYVRQIVREEPLPEDVLSLISLEMEGKIENLKSLMEHTSRVLSAIAEEAVVLSAPSLHELYLKELRLVSLDETRLLAVWCSTTGLVQDCLVEMEEAISSEEREQINCFINEELVGEPIDQLVEKLERKFESRRNSLKQLYKKTLQILRRSLPRWASPSVMVEGSRYILNQPEFRDLGKLQLLIATLEEKTNLLDLLSRPSTEGGVRVAIGEKELSKDIWDCSLVSAPYQLYGKYVGTIGVLGPRRMRYGRIMSLVHHVAEEMGQALMRWAS